jgi:sugar lactone lactonase YvrE
MTAAVLPLSWQVLPQSASKLGESPFWHSIESMLYWVDIPGRQICRANVFMGEVERWDLDDDPGCIAPVQSGGLVIALRSGIYLAPNWGGPLQRLVASPFDTRFERFNDGKCDALGRLWVGTLYEPKDKPLASLYCLLPTGAGGWQLIKMAGNATTGNGLAWSPSGTTLYWADTAAHRVKAFDHRVDATTFAQAPVLAHERSFYQFDPKPNGWHFGLEGAPPYGGRPDGAAVDVEGNYWITLFEGQRLCKISPQGQLLAQYATPALRSTMVCFGGDDGQTLYLTTASAGQTTAEMAQQPGAGQVFFARVPVPGLPVNYFDLTRVKT